MNPNASPRPVSKTTTNNAGEWLAAARHHLVPVTDVPLQEAQSLLGYVLGQPRAFLLAHPETCLSAAQQDQAGRLLERRAAGEPLPYLLGEWEFYGLAFHVSPAVLIPRPETELLVEAALEWLRQAQGRRQVADVGTGSGCIAVSLAVHVPDARVLAVDASLAALRIANKNITRHELEPRVRLARMDLLSAARGPFDLVCANLPYIPSATVDVLPVARYEPRLALDGGADGLQVVRRLLLDARRVTAPDGLLLLEVEASHGESAPRLARELLPGVAVDMLPDLAGLPRLLRIAL
jgi:release factor glutamine methyltransferase